MCMSEAVCAKAMTFSDDSLNEARMPGSILTDAKEGRWHLEGRKHIQHPLRRSRLRAVVKCEADATGSNSGPNPREGSTSE